MSICPCQMQKSNPKSYAECCEPLHKGKAVARSPEQLMRSRFSAFVLGLSQFLRETWHDSTRPVDLTVEPDSQWRRLDIIDHGKDWVHFIAYFETAPKQYGFLRERSRFLQENGHWLYVDGDVEQGNVQQERNALCLCGSGKKFKKCCGNS